MANLTPMADFLDQVMTGDKAFQCAAAGTSLALFVLFVMVMKHLILTSGMLTGLTTSMATLQTLTQAMPGSLQVILESTASKLHDELKDCMSYMREKLYDVQLLPTKACRA